MDICSAALYPFGFPYRSKLPHLEILKFIVDTLINEDNKVAFIRFYEDGSLAISYEFMKTYHHMKIIFQTTGVDVSSFNGESGFLIRHFLISQEIFY